MSDYLDRPIHVHEHAALATDGKNPTRPSRIKYSASYSGQSIRFTARSARFKHKQAVRLQGASNIATVQRNASPYTVSSRFDTVLGILLFLEDLR